MTKRKRDAVPYMLALAANEQLLEELVKRNVLVSCSATVLMDGRQVTAAHDSGLSDKQIAAHLEVRALEVMSRAMATAKKRDRVHTFELAPAHGDYSPGSLVAKVEMLAVALTAED